MRISRLTRPPTASKRRRTSRLRPSRRLTRYQRFAPEMLAGKGCRLGIVEVPGEVTPDQPEPK